MLSELPLLLKLLLGVAFVFAGIYGFGKLDDIDWDRYWPVILAATIVMIVLTKLL